MSTSGLKLYATNFSFGLKEITYLGYIITRELIKPNPKKVQGIIDLGWTTTTTESWALIGMVQYYRDMGPRRSPVSAPLEKADGGFKGRAIIWNDEMEAAFHYFKRVVSYDNLLNYPDFKMPFTVHVYSSDKQLGAVISQNNKPVFFREK